MAIEWILLAAACASFSDYLMRRSVDGRGSVAFFLVIQLFLSFLLAIVLHPIRLHDYSWSNGMAAFGFVGGIILGMMMKSLGKALELGPSGLTFATINSASVMPGLMLALIFGTAFECSYTRAHAIGSLMVVSGLFWAGSTTGQMVDKRKWLFFALLAFFLQSVGLVWMQWHALFINYPATPGLLLHFDVEATESQWFLPMLFLGAFFIQLLSVLRRRRDIPNKKAVINGSLGGVFNGAATFFLMTATECATGLQQAMLFPIFAVTVIVLCNLWGQLVYKEKVNWWANALCIIGLFIGTLYRT